MGDTAVREAFAAGQRSAKEGVGKPDSESDKEMRQRLRDMEGQLARAEGSAAALQDAASRAAERLQLQAVRERELEAKLASLGSVDGASWGVRAVLGAVGGMSTLVTTATSRCVKSKKEIEQEDMPLSSVITDGHEDVGTPSI